MAKIYTILYDANSPELDLNTWYASKGEPVLPGYRTNSSLLPWMTGANNENVGSMVANPNVDILASKIVLSDNLNWDIENQIVIFARQSMVFDGNGKTITFTKNAIIECCGLIAAPHQWSFRGWHHSLNDSGGYKGQYTYYRQDVAQWFDHIKDIDENNNLVEIPPNEDPYGITVKNLIIDAETNSIDIRSASRTHKYNGYMFGHINTGSRAYGQYGGGGRPMINANVTSETKNLFMVEKCQIKCIQSTISDYQGAFAGTMGGRGKFLNCIANTNFVGYSVTGWWEFENCLVNSNNNFQPGALNRQTAFEAPNPDPTTRAILYPPIGNDPFSQDSINHSHKSYNKYIFKNCVAKQIYYRFSEYWNAGTTNGTNPNITGGILEISGCKVSDSRLSNNYSWNNYIEGRATHSTMTNNTTNFAYLSGSSLDTSKLDDILAVINTTSTFKKENNDIVIQFSPFVGVSISDYLLVKTIDLSATDIVETSSVPTTWFNNLEGSGETLERNKEARRNNLIDTIFTTNPTKTFFDISKSVINLPTNSIKESTRIFKVDSGTNKATLNLNTNTDLGEKKGFYVPLTTNNQKVDITSKDGNITFQIERTGTGSDGKATYSITKTAGNSNLIIDS